MGEEDRDSQKDAAFRARSASGGESIVYDHTGNIVFPFAEIDSPTAHQILEAAAHIDITQITDTTPWDQLAGYSTEQLRQGMGYSTWYLMRDSNSAIYVTTEGDNLTRSIQKTTPEGVLTLSLVRRAPPQEKASVVEQLPTRSVRLAFTSSQNDSPLLLNEFSLLDPLDNEKPTIGFFDNRPAVQRSTSFAQLERTQAVGDFRHLASGLQWTAENMLAWNKPGIIPPKVSQ